MLVINWLISWSSDRWSDWDTCVMLVINWLFSWSSDRWSDWGTCVMLVINWLFSWSSDRWNDWDTCRSALWTGPVVGAAPVSPARNVRRQESPAGSEQRRRRRRSTPVTRLGQHHLGVVELIKRHAQDQEQPGAALHGWPRRLRQQQLREVAGRHDWWVWRSDTGHRGNTRFYRAVHFAQRRIYSVQIVFVNRRVWPHLSWWSWFYF